MSDFRDKFLKEAVGAYRKDSVHYRNQEREEIGRFIGDVINEAAKSGNLPIKKGQKPIILSVAANVALMERGIQQRVGSKMTVISGDIGVYAPRAHETPAIQADAKDLPLARESVSCVVDYLGASWHDMTLDASLTSGEEARLGQRMFKSYENHLLPGGLLIVDEHREGEKRSTGELIDMVMQSGIHGFELLRVSHDDNGHEVRIYRKTAKRSPRE